MGKFCSNCGNEIKENADFCLKCGKFVGNTLKEKQITKPQVIIKKEKGNGKSIASMVLGIIAIVFVLLELLSLETAKYEIILYSYISSVAGYIIGYTILSLPESIIGLILGISGRNEKQNSFNISGIILNSIVIVSNIFIIIQLLTAWY